MALDARGVCALLHACPVDEVASALLPVVVRWRRVDLGVVRAFLDCWAVSAPSAERTRALCGAAGEGSVPARWLLAELAQGAGDVAGALEQWDAVVAAGGAGQLAAALLARSRLLLHAGEVAGALVALREALRCGEFEQGFAVRADRLFARILAKTPGGVAGRPLRIAVLGSGTTAFLAQAVRVAAVRDGFAPVVYEGSYGAWRQEILDGESGLYAFAPEIVLVATSWRDANLPDFSASSADACAGVAGELRGLWEVLLSRVPCTILQNNFDVPWDDAAGHLGGVEPGARVACLRELNRVLASTAPKGVVVVDVDGVAALCGKARWASARQWHMSKQLPAAECLPVLADVYLGVIRAVAGLARKVLVLDLDNTLWAGVIGEDGLGGIRVGAPSAEGEAHAALQRYALELKGRGVLLAVCSKNNEADARLPFEKHEGMVLRMDDFVAFSANWEDKPSNLRRMARTLNLGVDSFVFIDDNPVERALMRRELPEVAVPEVDAADPSAFVSILHRGRWFESLALSAEDKGRHASYRANAERVALQAAAVDMGEFLRRLDMRVSRGAFGDAVFDRVTQLLGKTNQFNLTTRRHSREQVRQFASDGGTWTQWFRLEDRFGDNGLVGVMIATSMASDAQAWEIDTFLMSCRVIGRRMEDYMAAVLLDAARARGLRRVVGRYFPTAKNGMVASLYERLGFERVPVASAEAGGAGTFVFDLAVKTPMMPDCFQTVVTDGNR